MLDWNAYNGGSSGLFQRRVISQQSGPNMYSAGGGGLGVTPAAGGLAVPGAGPAATGDVVGSLQKQQDAANAANLARYNKLMGLATQFGVSQRRQAQQAGQQQLGAATSSLVNRGLYNSSVLDSVNSGINARTQDQLAGINQQVAEQQAGIVERRTDQGPNLGLYAQLLARPGALR